MSREHKYGLLSERQYKVLKMRIMGYTQEEIAKIMNTSRSNISIIEKNAWKNIRIALKTLDVYKEMFSIEKMIIKPSTHTLDIPRIIFEKADELGIKLKINLPYIQALLHIKADKCIKRRRVVRPIQIMILRDGDIEIRCENEDSLDEKI
ncbi:MAG: Tfx family DNA-binding protein [Desulfurococcales archaeon]|jgi:hypothetical protein|nr:Tfx family DNA-binding protein [Desulfurococcales archaeon]